MGGRDGLGGRASMWAVGERGMRKEKYTFFSAVLYTSLIIGELKIWTELIQSKPYFFSKCHKPAKPKF